MRNNNFRNILSASAVAGFALLIGAVLPFAADCQETAGPREYNNLAVAAGNVALGAVTGALGRAVRGERVDARALISGAAGGALVFAGKGIVAENAGIANLAGRQLAAVGSSAIRNAGAGAPFLSSMSLPWGPVRFHVITSKRAKVRVKFDVASTIAIAGAFLDDELEFESGASFTSGVAVFAVDSAVPARTLGGSQAGGVVQFRPHAEGLKASSATIQRIVGHELVHVIQSDFLFNVLSAPVEAKLMGISAGGRFINRYLDLGLNVPLGFALNSLIAYENRPWEREARTLAGTK